MRRVSVVVLLWISLARPIIAHTTRYGDDRGPLRDFLGRVLKALEDLRPILPPG